MRINKKIYIVKTSGTNSDGKTWEDTNFVKAEDGFRAIEEVKTRDRLHLDADSKHRVDDEFQYEETERSEIDLKSDENLMVWQLQQATDRAVDSALESVEYLMRKMIQLADTLKFQRENGSYNSFGEIQGAGSSVEVAIGQLTVLQEFKRYAK